MEGAQTACRWDVDQRIKLSTVMQYVEIGKQEGATIVTVRASPDGRPICARLVSRTDDFGDVTPSMRIAREESSVR